MRCGKMNDAADVAEIAAKSCRNSEGEAVCHQLDVRKIRGISKYSVKSVLLIVYRYRYLPQVQR